MTCSLCESSGKKMLKCSILGEICVRCCFNISSGSPEILKKLKDEKHLNKSEILKVCSECKQEMS